MVTSCSAYNCTARFRPESKTSFHRFPMNNEQLLRIWCIAIRRKDFSPNKSSRICSKHFTGDSFVKGTKSRTLKPDAVPTIFNFNSERINPRRHSAKKRFKRSGYCLVKVSNVEEASTKIFAASDNACEVASTHIASDDECEVASSHIASDDGCEVASTHIASDDGCEVVSTHVASDDRCEVASTQIAFDDGCEVVSAHIASDDGCEVASTQNSFDSLENENHVLRLTIQQLSREIERFECITTLLATKELISEEAAIILKSAIGRGNCSNSIS